MKILVTALFVFQAMGTSLFAAEETKVISDRAIGVALYGTVDYAWAEKVLEPHGLVPVKTVIDGKDRVVSGIGITRTLGGRLSTSESALDFDYLYGALAAKKSGDTDPTPGYMFFDVTTSSKESAAMLSELIPASHLSDSALALEFRGATEALQISGPVSIQMGAAPLYDPSSGEAPDLLKNVLQIPQTAPIDTRVFSQRGSDDQQVEYMYRFMYAGEGQFLYTRKWNSALGDKLALEGFSDSWRKYAEESDYQPDTWVFTDTPSIEYSGVKAVE